MEISYNHSQQNVANG